MISKDMTDALMIWFDQHRRDMPWRGSADPYHIWVSEMMLQQTQVATVEKYYHQWIKRFPDVFTLAAADLEDVLKVWEGLGYYTRARNFHKGAKYLVEHINVPGQPFPDNYDDWLKVPGVGPYTAAAVSSIAFAYPAAVVDGNVKRVMARLFCYGDDISKQKYHKKLFDIMNRGFYGYHPGWVNQAWMELGSLQCARDPDCLTCPLLTWCCAAQKNAVMQYPQKIKKEKIPTRAGAVFIIKKDDKTLMVRRPENGFLGGLWEYPGYLLKKHDEGYGEKFCTENNIRIIKKYPHIAKHSYSHFHQKMEIFAAELRDEWHHPSWTESRFVNNKEMDELPKSKITIKIADITRH